MPHLVFCAASAAIIPHQKGRSDRRNDSDRARISRDSSQDENPLLERFLADCTDQRFSTPCNELRSDLQPLRRVGKPLDCSARSLSSGSNASSNSPTCDFAEAFGPVAIQNSQATKSLLNMPGLSFADYVWATSASRKMRFEAIYI